MPAQFLLQRLFPTFKLAFYPTVTHNKFGATVHCRQSDLDSACGLHCAAMALTLLGRISHALSPSRRRHGVAARLWKAAQQSYFEGISEAELAKLLVSLKANVSVDYVEGSHRRTLAFAKKALDSGCLVILAYSSPNGAINHWVLVVGAEGHQTGRQFNHSALLTIDPSVKAPEMTAYNGRLHLNVHPIKTKPQFIEYVTNDGDKSPVTLTSAVSIGNALKPANVELPP